MTEIFILIKPKNHFTSYFLYKYSFVLFKRKEMFVAIFAESFKLSKTYPSENLNKLLSLNYLLSVN